MKKDFQGFNHGKGPIDLRHIGHAYQLMPVEIHLKEDGDLNDQPSLAIVLKNPDVDVTIIGQISVAMLNEGLADIGYKLVKT